MLNTPWLLQLYVFHYFRLSTNLSNPTCKYTQTKWFKEWPNTHTSYWPTIPTITGTSPPILTHTWTQKQRVSL